MAAALVPPAALGRNGAVAHTTKSTKSTKSAKATKATRFVRSAHSTISLPVWWTKEALCIHSHESVDWHRTTDWLGRPSYDHGGLQIDVRTWEHFALNAYPSDPATATPFEQLVVAFRIWHANGDRFGGHQWYLSAARCGVA